MRSSKNRLENLASAARVSPVILGTGAHMVNAMMFGNRETAAERGFNAATAAGASGDGPELGLNPAQVLGGPKLRGNLKRRASHHDAVRRTYDYCDGVGEQVVRVFRLRLPMTERRVS